MDSSPNISQRLGNGTKSQNVHRAQYASLSSSNKKLSLSNNVPVLYSSVILSDLCKWVNTTCVTKLQSAVTGDRMNAEQSILAEVIEIIKCFT